MKDQATKLRELVLKGEAEGSASKGRSGRCEPSLPLPAGGEVVGWREPKHSHSASRTSHETRIIAVTSGKGGVGKTTLAVNLALVLAEMPARVLLVDADLGLANVDVMLDMESGRHLGHLLLTNCTAPEVAADGPCGIKVISGGSGLRDLADADFEDRKTILGKIASYSKEFDYVIVDTSPGIGADVVDFLRLADDLLLVTTTEPTSITDTYAALKVATFEMPGKEVVVVVNSADTIQASATVKILNNVARKYLSRHCNCWYQIEHDSLVGKAVRERKPFIRTYPKSPAAVCVSRLANEMFYGHSPQKVLRGAA